MHSLKHSTRRIRPKHPCAFGIRRFCSTNGWATAQPPSERLYKQRHVWTKDQDAKLKELVANKGNAWTAIAAELGVKGSPAKVRRRWEVLEPKKSDAWTKSEDTKLARVISECTQLGHVFGERGWWVGIARMLGTGRSPRQCYARWAKTLLPMQGKALSVTRFKDIRGWYWSGDEILRLKVAVEEITAVRDPLETTERVQISEPWLVIPKNAAGNVNSQYWIYIAGQVGTRTSAQCIDKWKSLEAKRPLAAMDISQIKQLVQLVRTEGRHWVQLSKRHFPERSPIELLTVYRKWQRLESKYDVADMLSLNPFDMIRNFDGRSALRPTGSDGLYDKDGSLVRVSQVGTATALTPYHLALANVSSRRRKKLKIQRTFGLSDSTTSGFLPIDSMDKLVAVVTRHKNDWVSISREMGLPMHVCRRHLDRLASNLGSVKRLISDAELDSLYGKHGVAPEPQGKSNDK